MYLRGCEVGFWLVVWEVVCVVFRLAVWGVLGVVVWLAVLGVAVGVAFRLVV